MTCRSVNTVTRCFTTLPFASIASRERPCSRSATAPATGSTGLGFTVVVVVVVGATEVDVVPVCTTWPVCTVVVGRAVGDVIVDGAGEPLPGALPPVVAAKKPATNTSASALEPTSAFFIAQPFRPPPPLRRPPCNQKDARVVGKVEKVS